MWDWAGSLQKGKRNRAGKGPIVCRSPFRDEVSEEMDNVRRKEEQIGKVLQVKEEKLE